MNNILFIFIKVLSYLPFCRVTDDSNFGQVKKNSSIDNLRFSLLSLNVGKRIIHFITFKKNDSIKVVSILNLDDVSNYSLRIIQNGDKYDDYKLELRNKDKDKYLYEKEYLLYKISQTESVKSRTFNKYLVYISIISIVLPLYLSQATNMTTFLNSKIGFFIIILIYLFINFLMFIREFIKVKNIKRTLFRTIRNSPDPSIDLNTSLYYEWLNMEVESNYDVTIIKNIEKYMVGMIIWSVLFTAIYNGPEWFNQTENNSNKNVTENKHESSLIVFHNAKSFDDFLKKNNTYLNEIQNGLLENKYEKMILLTNKESNIAQKLLNLLQLYNSSNIDIIEIKDNAYTNSIELILLKEK